MRYRTILGLKVFLKAEYCVLFWLSRRAEEIERGKRGRLIVKQSDLALGIRPGNKPNDKKTYMYAIELPSGCPVGTRPIRLHPVQYAVASKCCSPLMGPPKPPEAFFIGPSLLPPLSHPELKLLVACGQRFFRTPPSQPRPTNLPSSRPLSAHIL